MIFDGGGWETQSAYGEFSRFFWGKVRKIPKKCLNLLKKISVNASNSNCATVEYIEFF